MPPMLGHVNGISHFCSNSEPRPQPTPVDPWVRSSRSVPAGGVGRAGAGSCWQPTAPRRLRAIAVRAVGGQGSEPNEGSVVGLLLGLLGRKQQASTIPEVSLDLGVVAREPVFSLFYRLYKEYGPIVRAKIGPKAFVIVSDPALAKQVMVTSVDKYNKGILAEILEFVMGQGLLAADGELWMARRKAVAPALQRKFVASQVAMFGQATGRGLPQLEAAAESRGSVEMESFFSRLSLDVVGKAVFDYEFNSLTNDDPVIQAVYTVLKEAESRSTAPFPYWKLPGIELLVPRLRISGEAIAVVNSTLDRLVAKCKRMLEEDTSRPKASPTTTAAAATDGTAEDAAGEPQEEPAPSVLQFLLSTTTTGAGTATAPSGPASASSQLITSRQLRDDLMTLLIAGHETTAAALTWALHLLAQHPEAVAKIREEVDAVCGDELPAAEDIPQLRYTARVVCETLRLFPQPPVLFRRAEQEDLLGGTHVIRPGTDLCISVWNLHHSPQLWDDSEAFRPERFGPLDGPLPSEANTDFRFMPFGGGRRKCVGDMFALYESVVALAVLLRRYDFTPDPSKPPVGLTTGATIHTTAGLHMLVTRRDLSGVSPPKPRTQAADADAGTAGAAGGASISGCPHAAAAAAATTTTAAAAATGCPHSVAS